MSKRARSSDPKPSSERGTPKSEQEPAKSQDVMLVRGPTADGKGYAVLRAKDDTLSTGVVTPLQEGKAVSGEVVRLKPRDPEQKEVAGVYDVETLVESTTPSASSNSGRPAKVSSDAYRKNWDRIWRQKRNSDKTLN